MAAAYCGTTATVGRHAPGVHPVPIGFVAIILLRPTAQDVLRVETTSARRLRRRRRRSKLALKGGEDFCGTDRQAYRLYDDGKRLLFRHAVHTLCCDAQPVTLAVPGPVLK